MIIVHVHNPHVIAIWYFVKARARTYSISPLSPSLSSLSLLFHLNLPFSSLSLRLLNHVFDPDLDKLTPREYIVYACPLGELGTAIEEYMDISNVRCGRNGAHKSFAHVTLCQFFKVSKLDHKHTETHTHGSYLHAPHSRTHSHARQYVPSIVDGEIPHTSLYACLVILWAICGYFSYWMPTALPIMGV